MSGDPSDPLSSPKARSSPEASNDLFSNTSIEISPYFDPIHASFSYFGPAPDLPDMIQNLDQVIPDAKGVMPNLLEFPDLSAQNDSFDTGSMIHISNSTPGAVEKRLEHTESTEAEEISHSLLNPSCSKAYNDSYTCSAGDGCLTLSPDLARSTCNLNGPATEHAVQEHSGTYTRHNPAFYSSLKLQPKIGDHFSTLSDSLIIPLKQNHSNDTAVQIMHSSKSSAKPLSKSRLKNASSRLVMAPLPPEKKRRCLTYPFSSFASSPVPKTSVTSTKARVSQQENDSESTSRANGDLKTNTALSGAAVRWTKAIPNNIGMNNSTPSPCGAPGTGPSAELPSASCYQEGTVVSVNEANGTDYVPLYLFATGAEALQYKAATQVAGEDGRPVPAGTAIDARLSPKSRNDVIEQVEANRKKQRCQLSELNGWREKKARRNRMLALQRLRYKKTLRANKKNTVRYPCWRRAAMARPRAKGRFLPEEKVEEC